MAHTAECQATKERRDFIRGLKAAARYVPAMYEEDDTKGTEEEMDHAWSVLRGCYNEYTDNGDQMSDACTCDHFEGFEAEPARPAGRWFPDGS